MYKKPAKHYQINVLFLPFAMDERVAIRLFLDYSIAATSFVYGL